MSSCLFKYKTFVNQERAYGLYFSKQAMRIQRHHIFSSEDWIQIDQVCNTQDKVETPLETDGHALFLINIQKQCSNNKIFWGKIIALWINLLGNVYTNYDVTSDQHSISWDEVFCPKEYETWEKFNHKEFKTSKYQKREKHTLLSIIKRLRNRSIPYLPRLIYKHSWFILITMFGKSLKEYFQTVGLPCKN